MADDTITVEESQGTRGLPAKTERGRLEMLAEKEQEASKRREIITQLFLRGLNQREMRETLANEFGITVSSYTISNDLKLLEEEHQVRAAKNYDKERIRDLERIEGMVRALWPAAANGSINAIKTVLQLLERKAKMLGTDEPIAINVTDLLIQEARRRGYDEKVYIEIAKEITE